MEATLSFRNHIYYFACTFVNENCSINATSFVYIVNHYLLVFKQFKHDCTFNLFLHWTMIVTLISPYIGPLLYF